jgi:hypothetical protein
MTYSSCLFVPSRGSRGKINNIAKCWQGKIKKTRTYGLFKALFL